ncbi:unnamed protein product [Symbiodinium sp. CCMP2592]|nr:unnamed protein product [Symbiodinium sp. CCMP2592]
MLLVTLESAWLNMPLQSSTTARARATSSRHSIKCVRRYQRWLRDAVDNALEELDRDPPPAQGPPAKRVRFGDSEVREFPAPSAPSEQEVEVPQIDAEANDHLSDYEPSLPSEYEGEDDLMGVAEAPKDDRTCLSKIMVGLGLKASPLEPTLFSNFSGWVQLGQKWTYIIALAYVDDLLIVSDSQEGVEFIHKSLSAVLKVKVTGRLHEDGQLEFLGRLIKLDGNNITLGVKPEYVRSVFSAFGWTEKDLAKVKPVATTPDIRALYDAEVFPAGNGETLEEEGATLVAFCDSNWGQLASHIWGEITKPLAICTDSASARQIAGMAAVVDAIVSGADWEAVAQDQKETVSRLRAECKGERLMAEVLEDAVTQQLGFWRHLIPSAHPTLLQGAQEAQEFSKASEEAQRGFQLQQQPTQNFSTILPLILRMLLRQEDELQMLRLDKAFCLFVDPVPGPGCILQALYRISQAWKEQKEQDPSQILAPLRVVLMEALLTELGNRLKMLPNNKEALDAALKNQWILQDGATLKWQFQSWDPITAKVIIHPKKQPLLATEVEAKLADALQLCQREGILHRFHATRPLSEEPKSPQSVFLLQVSLRSEAANTLHSILTSHGALRMRGVASSEHPLAPRASSEISACEANRSLPQELVLRLQLHNNGNCCYMNSLVLAMLWVSTRVRNCSQADLFGGLLTSVKPLLQGATQTFSLMTLFMWRMFVQAWPQPSRQHDVVEFAAFVMRKAQPLAYAGHWSAWDPEAPHSRKDWSGTHAPIIVDPILPECVLQDAVAVWEHDHLVRGS